ncbi:hypothetical protein FRX31_031880 [Thalictrum thalictroides]|uniref:Uncharacterized protein n=1 Tax=Thalictrum thalictroides TaxID=46969 RepID=A0A7J6V0Q2_THATH|nr:hypothetical protein FRX31_031880 [Thalictrum thalictroides]
MVLSISILLLIFICEALSFNFLMSYEEEREQKMNILQDLVLFAICKISLDLTDKETISSTPFFTSGSCNFFARDQVDAGTNLIALSQLVTIRAFAYDWSVQSQGQRVIDRNRPTGQINLVDWLNPSLLDWRKLMRIMDPQLEGRYPSKGAIQWRSVDDHDSLKILYVSRQFVLSRITKSVLYVPPPDVDARYEILFLHTRKMKVGDDVEARYEILLLHTRKMKVDDVDLSSIAEVTEILRNTIVV